MITITDHSVDFISPFDLEKFCENLSPIGLNRLQTALLSEQREREQRERFNKAKEKVIKSLDDLQEVIDAEEGKNSSCSFTLINDCFVNLALIKEGIDQLNLGYFEK